MHNEEIIIANFFDTWIYFTKCYVKRESYAKSKDFTCVYCDKKIDIATFPKIDICKPEKCKDYYHRRCLKTHVKKKTKLVVQTISENAANDPAYCYECKAELTKNDLLKIFGARKFIEHKNKAFLRLREELDKEAKKREEDRTYVQPRCAIY